MSEMEKVLEKVVSEMVDEVNPAHRICVATLRRKLLPLLEAGEEMRLYYEDLLGYKAAGSIQAWDAAKFAALKGDS